MKRVLAASALALVVMTTGCNPLFSPDSEQNVQNTEIKKGANVTFSIPLSTEAKSCVSTAVVTIYNGGKKILSQNLTVNGSVVEGIVENIPAGSNLTFTLDFIDRSGTVVYTGTATADIVSGQQTSVKIVLKKTTGSAEIIGIIEDADIVKDSVITTNPVPTVI